VDFFPITEPVIEGAATRVMSLRDGSKKMSKSDPSDQSRINLTDDADAIATKIRKARTDPEALPSEPRGSRGGPRRATWSTSMPRSRTAVAEVLAEVGGQQFSAFKPMLADLAVAKLSPISARMAELMADPAEIDRILARGAERARAVAAPILGRAYDIVGMIRSA
jgi:tryptophanyl-tRNA synthetase